MVHATSRGLSVCGICACRGAQVTGPVTGSATAATPQSEAFGHCLTGKATGDDCLLPARWMTFAFAAHPIVADAVTVDTSKLAETDQRTADLVMAAAGRALQRRSAGCGRGRRQCRCRPADSLRDAGQDRLAGGHADPTVMTTINAFATYLNQADLMTALGPRTEQADPARRSGWARRRVSRCSGSVRSRTVPSASATC